MKLNRLLTHPLFEASITDFRDLKVISCGPYSQLFQGKAKKDHKLYAIKKFIKKHIIKTKMISSVQAEIDTLKFLGENPYTINLHNFFEDQEAMYLQLESTQLGTLYQRLQKDKRIQENEAIPIIKQLVDIIEFLHNSNILHRDIKSESIQFKKNEKKQITIKLGDFGWSSIQDHQKMQFGGTAEYMAPEQYLKKPNTCAIDIWNLGVVIYEILVGKTPFEPTAIQLKNQKKPEVLQRNIITAKYALPSQYISAGAKDLLQQIFQIDAENRISILEIKQHWWLNNKQKPTKMEKSQQKQADNQSQQIQETTIPQMEIKTVISQARSSIKNKIQKHKRNKSKDIPRILADRQDNYVESIEAKLKALQIQYQQIQTENGNLYSQLALMSQDTQHMSDTNGMNSQRVSVINFTNYDSFHRQNFYKLQLSKYPFLKSEKFCIMQTLKEIEDKKQEILVAKAEIEKCEKEYNQQNLYKEELLKTQTVIEKQIQQIIEKREFMQVQVEIIRQQQQIEMKLEKMQENVDDEQLRLFYDELICLEITINEQSTNRVSRKTIQQQIVSDQVKSELDTYQIQYEEKITQLLGKYNDYRHEVKNKKEVVTEDIENNEIQLEQIQGNSSQLDVKLEQVKMKREELHLQLDSMQESESVLLKKIEEQERQLVIIKNKMTELSNSD